MPGKDIFDFQEIDKYFNNLRKKWQEDSEKFFSSSNDSSFPSTDRRIQYFRPSLEFTTETSNKSLTSGFGSDGTSTNLATTTGSNPTKYEVDIPLADGIGPEDLTVTLKDHVMTIEAKKESKQEEGNSSRRSLIEFKRKFTIPPNVDMREVKSTLTPDGHLKIEAPLPPPKQPAIQAAPAVRRETAIPIRHA